MACAFCAAGKHNLKTGLESPDPSSCLECPFAARCPGGAACAATYAGERCGLCSAGYYGYGDDCAACPNIPWGLIAMGIVGLVGAVLFLKFDTSHWTSVAALKQLCNYSQNVNVVELIGVIWPGTFVKIMSVLKFVSFDLEVTSPARARTTQRTRPVMWAPPQSEIHRFHRSL